MKELFNVAIYLRKSRDEGEYDDVLSKHRDTLVSIAENNGWQYKLYEEIGSGESIAKRKKMQQLLDDVNDGLYDGVLVMDIDRLGRGNHDDWAKIVKALVLSDTYVITPNKTYDLSEEQDEMFFDFQAIFAKTEYKMIKKRLRQGKIAGAKKGMWTNGSPPYPYEYNPTTRQLKVNQEKYDMYRFIIDKYLGGVSTFEIATWLNRNGVPTPYGKSRNKNGWSNNTVYRLLISEIHLGYVIYGKTRNICGRLQIVDKENWIKVKGNHEPVKTEEEHQQIMARATRSRILPQDNHSNVFPLSGLLYCSKCGRRMQFKRSVTNKEVYWTANCVFKYPDGSKCDQIGRKLDQAFYNELYKKIVKIDEQMIASINSKQEQMREIEALIGVKEAEIASIDNAINKLLELFEGGKLSTQILTERIEKHEKAKESLKTDIEQYRMALVPKNEVVSEEMILKSVNRFKKQLFSAVSPSEQNKAFRMLIDKIYYNRVDNVVNLEVQYK